ncbi:electron transfer flavoprotein subunit beta [candidate division KSB1 bacterium]|nr:MAG: electron transfer flavoprotein subunit beta [candidate division KSB1 bacterium]
MKIILCMKQVPLKDAQLKIADDQLWVEESNLNFEINESDHYGLEAALRLKEAHGGEVIVVSIGPARAKQAIQQALAKGADRAIHVTHEKPIMDPFIAAKLLAAAIKPENPDLILTGLQSDDTGFGQTGVVLAELLGLPHATLVMEIQVQDGKLKINQSGLAAIRYATIKGIMAAKKKPQQDVSAASLGVDLAQGQINFQKLYVPVKTKKTQMLTGDAKAVAKELAEKLKNEAKVI